MNIEIFSAVLGTVVLLGLTIFQIALIFGAPIGRFAWGGQHRTLPAKLRVSSAISILLYIIFTVFLLSKAGIISLLPDSIVLTVGVWIMFGYFVLGIAMNAVSRSKPERYLMTPVACILAISFFFVAL